MAGRKPEWSISALNPKTGIKGTIGAAWNNDDGTIQLKINPFVILNGADELQIRLFHADRVPSTAPVAQTLRTPARDYGKNDDQDEIPF